MRVSLHCFQDLYVYSHWQIEHAFARLNIKEGLRNEIRLLFKSFLAKGTFSFSSRRIEHSYGSYALKKLRAFVKQCGLVELVARAIPSQRSAVYKFKLSGIFRAKQCPTDMDSSVRYCLYGSSSFVVSKVDRVKVTIASSFLRTRAALWARACSAFGWSLHFDRSGQTSWGAAVVRGLRAASLHGADDELNAWTRNWLVKAQTEVSSAVYRIRHRCYHALVNCPRVLRHRMTFKYQDCQQPAVGIDMSATYTAILVSMMPPGNERCELETLLKAGQFYHDVNLSLPPELRFNFGVNSTYKAFKVEYQKQCIFWRDARLASRPIWTALARRFPALARHVSSLRRRLGVSDLSNLLMLREARFFIDDMTCWCDEQGIPVLPVHDALYVPASAAQAVHRRMEHRALVHFGYVPRLKIS